MRTVSVEPPSFPEVLSERGLAIEPGKVWQVLCGDGGHWRAGVYSPAGTSFEDVTELERHDCPELFLLLEGRMTLLCWVEGTVRELELQPLRPVLVTAPHAGFCPGGPHSGTAFVVERDRFTTEYREPGQW